MIQDEPGEQISNLRFFGIIALIAIVAGSAIWFAIHVIYTMEHEEILHNEYKEVIVFCTIFPEIRPFVAECMASESGAARWGMIDRVELHEIETKAMEYHFDRNKAKLTDLISVETE